MDSKWKKCKLIFDLQVPCQTSRASCNLRVKSNTCYCCELYNCGKWVCWVVAELLDCFGCVALWLFGLLDVYLLCNFFVGDFSFTAVLIVFRTRMFLFFLTFVSENILLWDFRIKMFWKSLGNHPWFGSRSLFSRPITDIHYQLFFFLSVFNITRNRNVPFPLHVPSQVWPKLHPCPHLFPSSVAASQT